MHVPQFQEILGRMLILVFGENAPKIEMIHLEEAPKLVLFVGFLAGLLFLLLSPIVRPSSFVFRFSYLRILSFLKTLASSRGKRAVYK